MPATAGDAQGGKTWHALAPDAVLAACEAGPDGLDEPEAAVRLAAAGPNSLPAAAQRSAISRFLGQFDSLLIYVLLASALVTALMGHPIDTAVILVAVLANAVIGHVQEGRAEQAMDAIRRMAGPRASVLRGGRRIAIPAEALVPGDIVLLEPGDRVPADLRLLRAHGLRIEEAVLTGESVAVEKGATAVEPGTPLAERTSMAFAGTLVAAGQGQGVAVATGPGTEIGRISRLLRDVKSLETPLIRQMNQFGRHLTFVILALAALAFLVGVGLRGMDWREAFMAVVGFSVAAIPEGLPAVMTIALAIGVRRMASHQAIIRRLPAVEALGAVSVICTDKTGTLTCNQMTVREIRCAGIAIAVGGSGYDPRGGFRAGTREIDPAGDPALMDLVRAGLLCSDAALRHGAAGWTAEGDPMEAALVAVAMKAGLQPAAERLATPRTDEIPFDAAHRFMATLHHDHTGHACILVKGAPEAVLSRCDAPAADWTAAVEQMAADGLRVLALARKPVAAEKRELVFVDVAGGLELVGLVGLMDPPREEAAEAIRDCRAAGIAVKMITGDHAITALAIARTLSLADRPAVLTGAELDGMDDAAMRRAALATDVFARTSPEHKLRLVEALQADGSVVAMTGDGVNDAPALKRADIGVAMGLKGTEAAKEAAQMVLADDNFATIVAAIRQGRTVYDNLTKMIAWTLPTNGGEAMAVVTAILLGLPMPVSTVQILWINLVTEVALGLTLAFEPTEEGSMRRPPRPAAGPLISGFLVWRTVLVSLLMVAGVFGLFAWATAAGASLATAQTLAVNLIVAMEIAYLFSIRFLYGASLTPAGVLGTPAVLIGVGFTLAAQIGLTYVPAMNDLFGTAPLTLAEAATVVLLGIGLFILLEAEKAIRRGRPSDFRPASSTGRR